MNVSNNRPLAEPTDFRRIVRAIGAMLLGLAGAAIFATTMDRTYPVKDWLFVSIVPLWAWALLWSGACLGFGQLVLVRILRLTHLPAQESAVLSMAIGVVGFVLAMYLGGALAFLTPAFAVSLALAMLALGAGDGYRLLIRWRLQFSMGRRTPLYPLVVVFGLACVALIYLTILTPDAVSYDSAWYHLRVAEDYARWGRIAPFYDYNSAVPHLASIVYTWGYLVPGLSGAQRWLMALHLEFMLFLWTLAGVAAGVQRLLDDFRVKGSWASFFLFPIIFVYDSNLGASADHVLAFFSVPLAIAALHAMKGFPIGGCALLAITLAGATLVKYQAVYLIGPIVGIVSLRWLWVRSRLAYTGEVVNSTYGKNVRWAPVILIGLSALCVSPHFVKNYVFYGNPVYPFMLDVFKHSRPMVPNASAYVKHVFVDPSWIPTGTMWTRFKHALELFFTFSFTPHYSCINNVPIFGSLFTLLLPGLALVQKRAALVVTSAMAVGAVLAWGMLYNVDRNLQTFMPVMVCVTGALIVGLWRLGWLARVGLIPLVLLQVVWGADAAFLPANGSYCSGADRISSAIAMIRSGYEGHAKSRFDRFFAGHVAVGKALPQDAKVLLHASHLTLGIDRDILVDLAGTQGLISYASVRSPRELYDYYRSLGITHVLDGSYGEATRQELAIFYVFLRRFGVPVDNGGGQLFALPKSPPPVESPYRVLCLGIDGYADGLYPIERLNAAEKLPRQLREYSSPSQPYVPTESSNLLRTANVVLLGAGQFDAVKAELANAFEQVHSANNVVVYAQRPR